jgi:hypothetical protein
VKTGGETEVRALQAASEELSAAAESALAAQASAAPKAAPVAHTDNVTVCIESFVPQGTFGEGRLDWVCTQPDMWSIQLDLHARALKRGSGPGAELWCSLGRFELAAISVFRRACCGSAAPVQAKVPSTPCGSLADRLVALGKAPSQEQVQRYDETMDCLAKRKVWFPERWSGIPPTQASHAFDEFLAFVRKR